VSILRGIIRSTLYVRARPNQFHIRRIEDGKEVVVSSQEPFTTRRLLIGEFLSAEATLREGMARLRPGPVFLSDPVVVIHPLEMTEGGISAVEHRVLMEVAHGAGAKRVTVWVGHELSDEEVKNKAHAA
jgi:hypothetical protein